MEAKRYFEDSHGPMTFGRSLRAWRESEEVSQDQLAQTVGLSKTAISRFENGHDFPSADTLVLLADALDADQAMWTVYIVRDMVAKKGFEGVEITVKQA